MSEINIKFDHPEVEPPDAALARATVVGTTAAGIIISAGETRTVEIEPGVYAIFVAVTTRAGTDWAIDITATGGDAQNKKDTGPETLLFSQIRVKDDA